MNVHLLAATTALLAVGSALAQTYVLAPDNAALSQPAATNLAWRDSTSGFRAQFVYDSSHFTTAGVSGPCVIRRLRFRAADGSTAAGGSYPGNGTTNGVTLDIGTCATDHANVGVTFAANRGAMQNVLTSATVNCAAGNGLAPNAYVIDIAIPGGFAYDPTLGQDLLVDVTGPDFIGTLPNFAAGVSLAASRCNRVAGVPAGATVGTITPGACPAVIFDITGPGGIPGDGTGSPRLVRATTTPFGTGCGPALSRAFAELFAAGANTSLDLGGGFTMTPNVAFAPTAYSVTAVPPAPLLATTSSPLASNTVPPGAMGDDSLSSVCSLPFAFPFVGGSTTEVQACTNGYLLLATSTAIGGDSSATLADLGGNTTGVHAGLPRVCPVWYDFHAGRNQALDPTAGVYYDVDAPNNRVIVTWKNLGEFATTAAGTKSFSFQVVLSRDGTIQVRYGAMTAFGSTSTTLGVKVTGFTPGASAPAPLSTDLSVAMPFLSSAQDRQPLALDATPARIGAPCVFSTAWVPSPGAVLQWIATVPLPGGIDLAAIGGAGCRAYVDPGSVVLGTLGFGTGTVAITLTLPANTALLGLPAQAQSAALAPGVNAIGAETSNGLTLTIGTVL